MTSNQLSYWKLQEEERTNKAKEQETARHNLSTEDLDRVRNAISSKKNEIEERGLKLKEDQLFTALTELYMENGLAGWEQLPDEWQEKIGEAFGLKSTNQKGWESMQDESWLANLYNEMKDWFTSSGFGKTISALF